MDLMVGAWRKSGRSDGNGGDCVELAVAWRKGSRSEGNGGQCVELAVVELAGGSARTC